MSKIFSRDGMISRRRLRDGVKLEAWRDGVMKIFDGIMSC